MRTAVAVVLTLAHLMVVADRPMAQERAWAPLPSPPSQTCENGLCQPSALAALGVALSQPGRPVRIVQVGDSHTAGGIISEGFRSRLEGAYPGHAITLEALGVVGETLSGLARRDRIVPEGPAPDLVVIAYGTNEGFDDALDPGAYAWLVRDQIARAKAEAPGASILVLGAPHAMRGGGGGTCAQDETGRWAEPVMLAVVRHIQHEQAERAGVAYWDWAGRTGDVCAAHSLSLGPDPVMRPDHVHFTHSGASWVAGLLFEDVQTALGR